MTFKYGLLDAVEIIATGDEGVIVGRVDYADERGTGYMVRYKEDHGIVDGRWWPEAAIEPARPRQVFAAFSGGWF